MMKQANQFLINNMLAQKVNVSKTSTKDPEIIEAWLKSGKDLTVTAMDGTMRLWLKFGVVWMEDRCSVADPLYDGRCNRILWIFHLMSSWRNGFIRTGLNFH